jgi:fibronectin-binding autotransporter adhesin
MKNKFVQIGAALLCAAITARAGTHTWTGGSPINANWSAIANWSGNNPPGVGERSVVVIFPAISQEYAPVQDIAGLQISQMQILGNYTFHGAGGAAYTFSGTNDVVLAGANSTFDDDVAINLDGKPDFVVSNGMTLTVQSPMQGAGGLNKRGAGTMRMEGVFGNTYTNETYVWEGTLQLAKNSGVSIAGDLCVGDYVGGSKADKVILQAANQIADDAWVIIHSSGYLNLNNFNETLWILDFVGGEVATGTGTLTLTGPLTASDAIDPLINDSAYLKGKVNIGSVAKAFSVDGSATFDVLATISGSADFHKYGSGYLFLSSSNAFSGPFTIHDGSVYVFDAFALGSVAGHTHVLNGATLDMGYSSIVNGETIHLNGLGFGGNGALSAQNGIGSPTLIGSLVLDSSASIFVGTNLTLSFKGVISGPGGYRKLGPGELWLDGGAANTYAGATYVDAGTLTLGKAANTIAVPGTLVVGDNIGAWQSDAVQLLNNGQLAISSVTVRSSGLLDIAQYVQTLGGLTIEGSGQVNVDNNGVLNMPTLVAFTNPETAIESESSPGLYSTPAITGNGEVHLVSATTISSTWQNGIYPRITGAASAHLIKTGEGFLSIDASNSYTGLTIIKAGVLGISDNFGLGSASGATQVTNSGALSVSYSVSAAEPLVLASDSQNQLNAALSSSTTNTWTGPITLLSNSVIKTQTGYGSGKLRIAGVIGGPGKLIKIGSDPLEVIGTSANTYAGGTAVNEGALWLNKTNAVAIPGGLTVGDGTNSAAADEVKLLLADQIADTSIVEVKQFGTLNLNSFTETIGSLQGAGVVNTVLGTLTAGGNNFSTTFSGFIGGVGFTSFVKQGTGFLLFTGTNNASGKTIVSGGKLIAHGLVTGAIYVSNNATLGGYGTVGPVFATNGIVSPGAGAGLIDTKNLALNSGSSVRIELNGTNAGVNCDQINVTGTVSLGSCTLDGTLGFASAISNKFIVIKNDGADAVVGTFAGLPEGATTLIGGATFKVSYVGGDGNDVVLTQITMPPQPTMGGVTRFPNGQIQINGQGVPGTIYNVLANTNLNTTNWVFIGTANPSPVTGNMQFTDTNAPNFQMRFYQFVLP